MVRRKARVSARSRGYTLVEAMIVVAILGTVLVMGGTLFTHMYQFYSQSDARTDVQRQLRVILDNINRDLRIGSASSVTISELSGQPPYSEITFNTVTGSTFTYEQDGTDLIQIHNNDHTTLTTNLQYIAFSYPETDDDTVLSISITLSKGTYSGRTSALQMAISKVRIMNP